MWEGILKYIKVSIYHICLKLLTCGRSTPKLYKNIIMWILGILVVIIIYEISQNFKNYSIGMPRTAKRQASLIKGPIGSNGRWRVIFLLSKSTSRLLFYIKDKIPLTAGDRGYRTRSIHEIQMLYLYWSIFYSSFKKKYNFWES